MRGFVAAGFAVAAWATTAFADNLSSLSSAWAADWSHKKLDAIMQLYAPQPVFLPTSGERWEGATAIRKAFAAALTRVSPDLKLKSLRSASSGDLGYDSGSYEETLTPMKGGAAVHPTGSYLFVFERQRGGDWKILEQTFTETAKP